jgi:tetratricopeptide (TPR) repeat protein/O-antigen ligase
MRVLSLALTAGVAATFLVLAIESPGDRFGAAVAGVSIGVWLAATLVRRGWQRSNPREAFAPHPLALFLILSSAVYTLLALEAGDLELRPTPDQPDFVPGLSTNLTVYYLSVHAAIVAAVVLYAREPARLLETALAVQVAYLTPLYEPVLQLDEGAPLLLGNAVVFAAWALAAPRDLGVERFRWTPVGAPLAALTVAALIATIPSTYVQHSLVVDAKIGALVLLVLLITNAVRHERQLWLLGAAWVLPTAAMAAQVLYKLVEIGNHMGIEYAVRYRFHFLGLIGSNTIGLAIIVALLLIGLGFFRTSSVRTKVALGVLVVPMVPVILSLRSSSTLVSMIVATIAVAIAANRELIPVARRLVRPAGALAGAGVVALIAVFLFVPNPYRSEWSDELSDPTTGRGVRAHAWEWSLDDIGENPLIGIGPADRRFEARNQQMSEFPFRDVTDLGERRLLLGGTGTYWRLIVWGHPHNIVLVVLETMGVIGLVTLLWLFGALAAMGLDLTLRPMTRDRRTATAAIAGVGGCLAWGMFSLGQDVAMLPLPAWPALGLLGAAYCLAYPPGQSMMPEGLAPELSRATKAAARLRPWLAPALGLALTVAFLGMVARPVIAESIADRGRDARADARLDAAVERLVDARRLDPISADYLRDLAPLYVRTGDMPQALAAAERLAEVQPETASHHTTLGWMRWLSGDLDGAQRSFARAVELDPWNALGSNNWAALGLSNIARGRRDDALDAFVQAIFVDPGAAADRAWLATARPDGSADRVLDPAYFPATQDDGRLRPLLLRRTNVPTAEIPPPPLPPPAERTLYLSEVLERAYAAYKTERASDLERALGMLSAISRAYARVDLPKAALELLLQLRDETPEEPYVHYEIGLAYSALERDADARAAFEEVVRLAEATPTYIVHEPFAHYQLGLIDEREGDDEAALREFRETLDTYRWPYFPEAYRALARTARRTGNIDEASRTLDRLRYLLEDEAAAPANAP